MKTDKPIITSLLDLDWYKLTMGAFIHDNLPMAKSQVTFKLFDRDKVVYFLDPMEIAEEMRAVSELKFTSQELHYLRGHNLFSERYLKFLANLHLSGGGFVVDSGTSEVTVHGPWEEVTYWETILMSIVNELITRQGAFSALDKFNNRRYWSTQYVKFCEKIDACEREGIQFSDFGTRRRASKAWQHQLIESLVEHKTKGFLGTSNVALAMEFGIPPIGTMAHELFMVTTAPNIDVKATERICQDWMHKTKFPRILLTDTYTTSWFFKYVEPWIIGSFDGFRWDSGDPDVFTKQVLDYLAVSHGYSKDFKIIYSDRMTVEKMARLHKTYSPLIRTLFGWGTDLTNPNPTGWICKAMEVDGHKTVKLSDDPNKALGEEVEKYRQAFNT